MSLHRLRFRQVHLDFHTSGAIAGVGARFDKSQFQDCLREAHVDSVTCFSKCHHGWSYHETKVGRRHPHLDIELLDRQIEACREIGVRVPIYISAGVDELMAMEHPEWVQKHLDGTTYDPLEAGWFKLLRWNSPYLDYLCRQIEEVVDRWRDADGVFLDIIRPIPDYSEPSLRDMLEKGIDPAKPEEVAEWANGHLLRYFERTTAAARKHRDNMPVFHNSGHISIGAHRYLGFNSHLELESLPTGGWGYDHFPLSARYAIQLPFDFLGMTGKFHTTWGEFGGFKRPAALRYECAAMLAYGAKCSVGDQLHPSGEMNRDTCALIGEAFREVEAKERWCDGVEPVAQIGLLSAVADQSSPKSHTDICHADEGAARVLLEAHMPFVVLDRFAEWNGLDLVILPDNVELDDALLERAKRHLAAGGKILASGCSLLDAAREQFLLDAGVELVGRSEFDPDYLVANQLSGGISVRSPIVIHGGAWNAKLAGAEPFAARANPWFNRTWRHFCSHQHTPDAGASEYPGATIRDGIAWFAHDIFTRYRLYGQPLYRDFVVAAIRRLLDGRVLIETSLPSTGRVNLLRQPRENRLILHLLHAVPSLRGNASGPDAKAVEVIEEVQPLHDVRCVLRLAAPPASVRLQPQDKPLEWREDDGAVRFTVPKLEGHQMIEIAF